ncbi:hypothetical protein ACFWIB_15190 [Streptomyces sp. NPDC127051]|uniref:hypothetical protein n=1 Tax=Streptomyces sp. NPDC127051 TaxID=3347119 RepID=UPI00364C9F35
MGYTPKRKIYNLDFEGTDFEGLTVSVRGLNTGQYLDLWEAKAEAEAGGETGRVLYLLAGQLIGWNVEDDQGQPVPPTFDGIKSQDLDLNLAIVNAWTTAMAGVPAPLEPSSSGGGPSLEASLPMEPLSPSLAL